MEIKCTSTSRHSIDLYETMHEIFLHLFKKVKSMGNKKYEATLNKIKVHIINNVLNGIKGAQCVQGKALQLFIWVACIWRSLIFLRLS